MCAYELERMNVRVWNPHNSWKLHLGKAPRSDGPRAAIAHSCIEAHQKRHQTCSYILSDYQNIATLLSEIP